MFDIDKFANEVCDVAYPNSEDNEWRYRVDDIFGKEVSKGNVHLVQVKWRLSGMERGGLDEPLTRSINFELSVNASAVVALNAFHYALMIKVRQTYGVDLSDIVGDVEEDEPVGRTTRESGRVYRVWGLRVDDLVTGMQPLFEMKED